MTREEKIAEGRWWLACLLVLECQDNKDFYIKSLSATVEGLQDFRNLCLQCAKEFKLDVLEVTATMLKFVNGSKIRFIISPPPKERNRDQAM